MDRIRLRTVPGVSAGVAVHDMEGTARAEMLTGGNPMLGGMAAHNAGFIFYATDGTRLGRLGTHAMGNGSVLHLSDRQGNDRILLAVEGDGTPSIQLLDAMGNVTWTAR